MENRLKITLKANESLKNDDFLYAHIESQGELELDGIIDAMLEEGINAEREHIKDIISRFNRKAAKLVLSGCNVNTGLVRMTPKISGPLYKRNWDSSFNSISVSLQSDTELIKAIDEAAVEIQDEHIELTKAKIDLSQQMIKEELSQKSLSQASDADLDLNGTPPCGVAFRRWLQNS